MNNENPGECATRISHKKRSKNKNHNHLYSNCGGFMPVKIYAVVVLVMDVTVKHNTIFAQMNRSDEPEKSMFSVYNTIFHAFSLRICCGTVFQFHFYYDDEHVYKSNKKNTHTQQWHRAAFFYFLLCFAYSFALLHCIAFNASRFHSPLNRRNITFNVLYEKLSSTSNVPDCCWR